MGRSGRAELAVGWPLAPAGRLEIVYQPIIDLATSEVRDVEAQVRWPRADGPVPPEELRALAEDSGLAAQVAGWALREACRQVADWRSQGREVGLSVNCTRQQVSGARLVSSVLAALDEAELPPQALTLEIAENELIECGGSMAADLAELRCKGIRIAADSFGTSYGSLAFLRRQRVDVVKIDSSLVAGLEADPTLALVTKTIVAFARKLGVEVIAEGIVSPRQRADLAAMGCGLGQGPGAGQPWPAADDPGPQGVSAGEPVPISVVAPTSTGHGGDTACSTAS